MKRSVIRITIFILLLCAALYFVDRVLFPKFGDGIYDLKKYYELEEDTVDVLVLGSSMCFENFNTGTLWDEYGISAFDLGGSNQPPWNTYHYLKEALKTQKPKLIILEASNVKTYEEYSAQQYIVKNNYGLKWSRNKVDSLLASIRKEQRTTYIPEFLRYHYRYSDLSRADFLTDQGNPLYYDWKGFVCNMGTFPTEAPDLSQVTQIGYLSEKSEWYYNHIIELAQSENIPIEIVIAPYADCYDEEMEALNRAEEIAQEKGAPFMNCLRMTDEIGIDFSTDMADPVHLNYKGNRKFTHFIGEYITGKYDLPDHRNDERYATWQRQADYIRRLIADQELRECALPGDYIDLITDKDFKDYEVFVSVDEAGDELRDAAGDVLERLGIDPAASGVWYIKDGDVIWASSDKDTDLYLELPLSDIHLKKCDEGSDEGNSIMVGSIDCKTNTTGINIVIYDNISARVVDSAALLPDEASSGSIKLFRNDELPGGGSLTEGF